MHARYARGGGAITTIRGDGPHRVRSITFFRSSAPHRLQSPFDGPDPAFEALCCLTDLIGRSEQDVPPRYHRLASLARDHADDLAQLLASPLIQGGRYYSLARARWVIVLRTNMCSEWLPTEIKLH